MHFRTGSPAALRQPDFPPPYKVKSVSCGTQELIPFEDPGFPVHCGKVGMWYLVGGRVSRSIVGKVRPWCIQNQGKPCLVRTVK